MTTNLPSQSSSTPPALAFDSGLEDKSPNPSTSSRGPRQYRAITHVATLTAFVLPIFLLPYLLTRRRLSLINQRIDKVGANARVLQQDLNGIYSELAVRKDEHRRLKALVYDTMRETDELQLQAEQQDAKQSASNESIRSDIQKLLDETQYTRTQAVTLRALGASLADVAAFMHEIELEMGMNQGKDHRGIDKLRRLALRMESFPQDDKVSSVQPENPPASRHY